ncbi:hypothetical protein Prum_031940 [Phytohabitans rumicis]|uniref:Uncharacterized protein n=1 Tax=Phytohabitans rumicis TaxID=1076125 RepID=A0A6V8KWU0_9ACTN|nr:hypothetical protein Prum_031940 [Phytohabitans rumicis]
MRSTAGMIAVPQMTAAARTPAAASAARRRRPTTTRATIRKTVRTRMSGLVNVHQTAVAVAPAKNQTDRVRPQRSNSARVTTASEIDSDSDRMAKSQLATWGSRPSRRTPVTATHRAASVRSQVHSAQASSAHATVPTVHCAIARAWSLGKIA